MSTLRVDTIETTDGAYQVEVNGLGGLRPVSSVAEVQALDPAFTKAVVLNAGGRSGQFVWRTGDYSAHHAADTLSGVYIKAASVASTAGSWVRVRENLTELSVDWFGAAKDGVTDDAACFNAARAVLVLLGGGWVNLSVGTYFVGATIVGASGVFWRGAGGIQSVLYRTGSYGHTFSQAGGFGKIHGIHFAHSIIPGAGAVSIANRLTDGSAHIYLNQTQQFEIYGNRIVRMPYGILHDGAVNTHIDFNWLIGWWDNSNVAGQEGVADISFIGNSAHGQLCKITRNYFSGAYNGTRSYTFSNGGNNSVQNIGYNTGRQNAIFATSIEDLEVSNNYFGRNAQSLIRFALTSAANDILIDLRIRGNLFDNAGNGYHHITTESLVSTKYALGLDISGNTFNGEYDSITCVLATANAADSTKPSVINLTVSHNNMFATVGCPISLGGAKGAVVSGNSIQGYNCFNVGLYASGTPDYKAGVYVYGASDDCLVEGNKIGGGGNEASATAANYCYQGVVISSATGKYNYERNNVLTLNDGSGNAKRGISAGGVSTVAGTYQAGAQDSVVMMANTSGGAVTVALPVYPVAGQRLTVKDSGGNAGSLNIQIIPGTGGGTIDGAGSVTINSNFGVRNFVYNGSFWCTL